MCGGPQIEVSVILISLTHCGRVKTDEDLERKILILFHLDKNCRVFIQIIQKCVPMRPRDNKPALVQKWFDA